jgi:chromate transporter
MIAGSALYTSTHDIPVVAAAFNGLRAMVIALLASAALDFARTYLRHRNAMIIAVSAACLFACNLNPVPVILGAGLAGRFLCLKNGARQQDAPAEQRREPSRNLQLFFLCLCVALGFGGLYLVDRQLFDLALLMSRIDLFAFGGGYTSVPLMFHEVVEVRAWLDSQTLLDGIALGQVTPGPIVLTATFVGYMLRGLSGGIVGTLCIFLPSVLLVIGIVPYFDKLKNLPHFASIMGGILCSFVGLILSVTVLFGLEIPWDIPRTLLAGATFIALLLQVELVWVVCAGTAVSVLFL